MTEVVFSAFRNHQARRRKLGVRYIPSLSGDRKPCTSHLRWSPYKRSSIVWENLLFPPWPSQKSKPSPTISSRIKINWLDEIKTFRQRASPASYPLCIDNMANHAMLRYPQLMANRRLSTARTQIWMVVRSSARSVVRVLKTTIRAK